MHSFEVHFWVSNIGITYYEQVGVILPCPAFNAKYKQIWEWKASAGQYTTS